MGRSVEPICWESDYETAVARARQEKKEILVYFHKPE